MLQEGMDAPDFTLPTDGGGEVTLSDYRGKKVEVEVSTIEDALEAARADVDIVMLDNFTPEQVRRTMGLLKKKRLRKKVLIESSGGITEKNILEFAAVGVDIISLGEITGSAKALDMSLEIVKVRRSRS